MIKRTNTDPPVLSLYPSHKVASIDMPGNANLAAAALDSNVALNHQGNLVLAAGLVIAPYQAAALSNSLATVTHKIQRIDYYKEHRSWNFGWSSTWVYQRSSFSPLELPSTVFVDVVLSTTFLVDSISFAMSFSQDALDTATGEYDVFFTVAGEAVGNVVRSSGVGIVLVSELNALLPAGAAIKLNIRPVLVRSEDTYFSNNSATAVNTHSFAWAVSTVVLSVGRGVWSWSVSVGGGFEVSGKENYQTTGTAYRGFDMGIVPADVGSLTIRAGEGGGSAITIYGYGTNTKADYDTANVAAMVLVYAENSVPSTEISAAPYQFFVFKMVLNAGPSNLSSPEIFEISANFSGVPTRLATVIKAVGDGEQCVQSIQSQSSQLNTSAAESAYGQATVVVGLVSQSVRDIVDAVGDGNVGVISAGNQELYRGVIDDVIIKDGVSASLVFSDNITLFDGLISAVVYSNMHIIDVMLDLILNKLGAVRSRVDIDSFNQVKQLVPYLASRSIVKPVQAKKLLEELAWLAFSKFAMVSGRLAVIPDAFVRADVGRFSRSSIYTLDINNCGGPVTLKRGYKKGLNLMLIEGGYTGEGGGQDKYSLTSVYADAADLLKSDKVRFQKYQDNWGLSQAHLDDRAQKQVAAFSGGRWSASISVDISNVILQVGDMVQVNLPTLPVRYKNALAIVAAANTDTLQNHQKITILGA